MNFIKHTAAAAAFIFAILCGGLALADYHLERITPVLNQPTFVTQAPGDPTNILYYTTRISSSASGFTTNLMGKVWRYDVATRTATTVLDLGSRLIRDDDGLECIAFHPDFNTSNSAFYGKMYVSSAQRGTTASNLVEEFTLLNPDGTFKTTNEVYNTARVILRYTNSSQNNHTVGWIGFDPNATPSNRHQLYISTGDGSYGNSYNSASGTNGRPSQNPNDIKGKILRVDISGGDDLPGDTNRNYVVPTNNPFPTYLAANPGATNVGLGEVYVTGVRNGYRMSFDRTTSDIWWGDVGENAWEEVDFLKAGDHAAGPPADYGWPQLEATHNSPISGAPHTSTNPFTLVTSYNPVREWPQVSGNGGAAIGGYVYRGPIPELQGKYFFADFVNSKIWMLDFDRNTSPATFNGANGTLTDMTVIWNTLIVDSTNYNYRGDTNIATLNGLDHVVSFGEDNDGNLYVVDFGYGSGFSGHYTANAGEIYKLVPGAVPGPTLNWTNTGTNVQFSWSGSLFKLQDQTNSLSAGGWLDYPTGSNSPVNVPFNKSLATVSFRLIQKP